MRVVRAIGSSIGMYTVIPIPRRDWQPSDFADSLTAFPVVGAGLGAFVGVLGWGAAAASGSPTLGGVLALAVLALATGAMHLDGVADVADALGSRKPAPEARAIMKRSDIGPMGVTSALFVLLLEVAALGVLPPRSWPVAMAAAMAAGRVTPLAANLPGLGERPDPGTLSALTAGTSARGRLWACRGTVVAASAALAWWVFGPWGAAVTAGAIVVAWLLAAIWQAHLLRRLGRLNGDCYGSLIELSQLCIWLVLALFARVIV